MTATSDTIIVNLYIDARESLLNVDGPLSKGKRHVEITLVGAGKEAVIDGVEYYQYEYPVDIKVFPHEGNMGSAHVAKDRQSVDIRMYWMDAQGRKVDSIINGKYTRQ